jgi:hypothetical protein
MNCSQKTINGQRIIKSDLKIQLKHRKTASGRLVHKLFFTFKNNTKSWWDKPTLEKQTG